jgi:hypothetical protein
MFLTEPADKHVINDTEILIDGAPWLHADYSTWACASIM